MPFLRFTRDKRGYENTFLVHAYRRRGKSRDRILYWFRTPPNVKVGRGALDEDAIRSIEENNRDLSFDWPKILEIKPPLAPLPEGAKPFRARRTKSVAGAATPAVAAPEQSKTGVRELRHERPEPGQASEPVVEVEEVAESGQIAEPLELADAASIDEPGRSAVEALIGREQLAKLRARHSELRARITERGGEASRIEVLRAQAELLNPDAWVTADEATKGLEEFETRVQELRHQLGLRKRRRSRRGGVRRRRGRGVPAPAALGEATLGGRPEDAGMPDVGPTARPEEDAGGETFDAGPDRTDGPDEDREPN